MTFFIAFVGKADTASRWVSRLSPNTWPMQGFQSFGSADCLSISGAATQRDNHNQVSPHVSFNEPHGATVENLCSVYSRWNLTNTFVVKNAFKTESQKHFRNVCGQMVSPPLWARLKYRSRFGWVARSRAHSTQASRLTGTICSRPRTGSSAIVRQIPCKNNTEFVFSTAVSNLCVFERPLHVQITIWEPPRSNPPQVNNGAKFYFLLLLRSFFEKWL